MVHGLVDVVYSGHRVDVAVSRPLIGVDGGSSSDLSPDKWGGGGGRCVPSLGMKEAEFLGAS